MSHSHGAGAHGHAGAAHRWRLLVALVLIGGFFVVELITGLLSGSLALLSDAGHMGPTSSPSPRPSRPRTWPPGPARTSGAPSATTASRSSPPWRRC